MSLSDIIQSVNAAVDALPNAGDIKNEERMELLAACERLKAPLETPLEAVTRISFGTHVAVAVRLGIQMGIFNVFVVAKGAEVNVEELATKTGADPLLIIRLMRILTGMNLFKEAGPTRYTAAPLAGVFVDGSPLADAITHMGMHAEVLVKLPDYFAENGYKNPGDAYAGPFQYAFDTKLHYFDWLKEQPKQQAAFNSLMRISRMDRGEEWFDIFPVTDKFHDSAIDTSTPLLVDIGGGLGHDLIAFKARYPDMSGRLVLQDLPVAIDDIKEISRGIETMKYDFFTPQPIKGARAYYMRTVLHDWPDKQALKILQNVLAAMTEDSILLVNENVLPDANVPLYPAELDFSMMAIFSSLERTQRQWLELLDLAGFDMVKVWTPRVPVIGSGTLFEAVPKK